MFINIIIERYNMNNVNFYDILYHIAILLTILRDKLLNLRNIF